MKPDVRTEHDLLGAHSIPAGAYWGVHTARAVENFQVSGITLAAHREVVPTVYFRAKFAAKIQKHQKMSHNMRKRFFTLNQDQRSGAL